MGEAAPRTSSITFKLTGAAADMDSLDVTKSADCIHPWLSML
jgi:hypothetical protein